MRHPSRRPSVRELRLAADLYAPLPSSPRSALASRAALTAATAGMQPWFAEITKAVAGDLIRRGDLDPRLPGLLNDLAAADH